jgi:hypothetical protein
MPTEAGRHRLYDKIKEQWGEEHAAELMSYLPPVGWADAATKQDLDALRGDFAAFRVATKQDVALLGAEVRGELERGFKDQLKWVLGAVLTSQAVMTGTFAAIVNWLG